MLKEEDMIAEHSRWGVAERRAFMLLSLEERRHILTQQANDLLGHYRNEEKRARSTRLARRRCCRALACPPRFVATSGWLISIQPLEPRLGRLDQPS